MTSFNQQLVLANNSIFFNYNTFFLQKLTRSDKTHTLPNRSDKMENEVHSVVIRFGYY